MTFIGDFHLFEGRCDLTPGIGEVFFELFVSRQHARIGFRHIDHRAPVKVGGAQVKLVGRLLAIILFEAGGEILVFLGDLGPFFMPAFEIEKFDAPGDAADIGVGMVRRNFHAHFELPATGQPFGGVKKTLGLFAVEDVAAGFVSHSRTPCEWSKLATHSCLPQEG